MMYWGKHLVLDVQKCTPQAIRSRKAIDAFARHLVRDIKMVPYGEPQIQMFGTGNKKGYTLVQLIETSNICAHFAEETNDMYLDVFSCKDFDQRRVEKLVRSYFQPMHMTGRVLYRDAKLPAIDVHMK